MAINPVVGGIQDHKNRLYDRLMAIDGEIQGISESIDALYELWAAKKKRRGELIAEAGDAGKTIMDVIASERKSSNVSTNAKRARRS